MKDGYIHVGCYADFTTRHAPCGALVSSPDFDADLQSSCGDDLSRVTCPVCKALVATLVRLYRKATLGKAKWSEHLPGWEKPKRGTRRPYIPEAMRDVMRREREIVQKAKLPGKIEVERVRADDHTAGLSLDPPRVNMWRGLRWLGSWSWEPGRGIGDRLQGNARVDPEIAKKLADLLLKKGR